MPKPTTQRLVAVATGQKPFTLFFAAPIIKKTEGVVNKRH